MYRVSKMWNNLFKWLREIVHSLKDDGILTVFEPNSNLFLRQIMYRSKLSKDVYPYYAGVTTF